MSPSLTPLRILTFGAGAIGVYIGGSLALHGHAVTFLERPQVAAELAQRGLRLKLFEQEHRLVSPSLADSLLAALSQGPYDLALFALKSFDTGAALEEMRPYRDLLPPILCLQNGVENEAALAEVLGAEKVIAGTVTSAVARRATGDIVLERLRGVGIAAGHPMSPHLAQAFSAAGLRARLYPSPLAMKWSKLLTNLLANATSAILDMQPAEIFAHPGLYRLEIEQLREALRVMAAQGLAVVDLPGTPVRLLTLAVRHLPVTLSRPVLRRAVSGGRGGKMPSFYLDLVSGRGVTEVDALNGAVVRFGKRLGVPTPVNQLLNQVLQALAAGDVPRETFARKPQQLLAGWVKANA